MNHLQLQRSILLLFALGIGTLFFSEFFVSQNVFARSQAENSLLQISPEVEFNIGSQTVPESEGDMTIAVNIDTSPTYTVTVNYIILGDGATSGQDFSGTNGTLTFPIGSTAQQTFTLTIIDDSIYEENTERINLILQDVVSGTLGSRSSSTITITDNESEPVTGAPIFTDASEPNDSFGDAADVSTNADSLCELTVWPIGDVDYFRFNAKKNLSYKIFTSGLDDGLDTFIRIFDPSLKQIASNDDNSTIGSRASEVTILAKKNGFYYVEVTNVDPSDPTNKEYCIDVDEIAELTPTPSNTPDPDQDDCEFNSTFETSCLVGIGEEVALTFVPANGSEQDTDILKMWVLPGVLYTCETFNLSAVADTNIILYNQDRQPFNPWIGNADRAVGDPSSEVQYLSTYKGWLYAMIGPENPPPYEEAALHTYSARCTAIVATSTPTPTPTFVPSSGTGGGFVNTPVPTPTPFEFPTPVPTPTPIDFSVLTPLPPTPAVINIQPLPTSTAVSGSTQALTVNVTLYYDNNNNFMPELTEGIMDAAVALYDNATGGLIAFGYTNEAGMAQFSNIEAGGAVRVDVPFLNYSQVVLASNSEILVRVAPQPLPIGIP